jgi:hypothetical protein
MDWRCALHGTALASPEFKVQSHFVIAIVVLGFELKALCLLAGALSHVSSWISFDTHHLPSFLVFLFLIQRALCVLRIFFFLLIFTFKNILSFLFFVFIYF